MHNFFINEQDVIDNKVNISGQDFNHVKNVLRMKVGDTFLVSLNSKSHLCKIVEIFSESLTAEIVEENYMDTSLPIDVYLFQGMPKSDKLELIIQKAVELGVYQIIPVQMERSIAKIEDKKVKQKVERFNAISQSAAEQCKRSFVPL